MGDSIKGGRIPLLPLRDIVVFPHMVVPLFVGRPKSIQALEDAMAGDRQLVVAAQRQAGEEDPTPEDIYSVGTLGTIIQLLRLPDGTVKVLVEGKSRAEIRSFVAVVNPGRGGPFRPDQVQVLLQGADCALSWIIWAALNPSISP